MEAQLRAWTIVSLSGLYLFTLLGGCSPLQQQEFVDATIGRAFGRGRTKSQAMPAQAALPRSSAPAPASSASVIPSSTSEELVLVWQKTMTEHPQIYLDCLQDSQCGPALKGYLSRLQQQAARSLELPAAYNSYSLPYDLKKP